jgi:hypothetical protein
LVGQQNAQKNKAPAELSAGDAPEWIRTTTPVRAQALNLLRMPIPPPGQVAQYYTLDHDVLSKKKA